MTPQTSIPPAANILGTLATVCWCIQLVPQVWSNWRTKKTEGLPGAMMFLWAMCAIPFAVYNIVQNFNIPLQVQPHIFCVLSFISWGQVLVYNNYWRTWTATLLILAIAIVSAGVEVLLILTLRPVYVKGISWPITMIGIIAAVLLAISLLPPYYEIWKRNGRVVGMNFLFITIDWLGAVFSVVALAVQHSFDPLGGVLYSIVIVLELGYFISQAIFLIRTRKFRAHAKAEGIDFDDLPEARKYQWHAPKPKAQLGAAEHEDCEELASTGSDSVVINDSKRLRLWAKPAA